MSIVEITNHDESIYEIIKKPPPEPPKTPRYESELERQLKAQKIPQLRRTFGYAETPLNPPTKFLKKGEGFTQPIKKSDHKCYVTGNLPPVPKRPPPGKGPQKPTVNFRVLNIKKAIKTKMTPAKPRLVDTRDGHVKTIKGSGEVPEYCLQPGFGKMPKYLLRRNEKLYKAQQAADNEEASRESLCKLIAEDEYKKLLADLKNTWEKLQKAFLQLPMLTDTIPKIIRKTALEKELKELERDIALVERNPYIYVYES